MLLDAFHYETFNNNGWITLPETNSSPLKMDPWKFGDSNWKASFSVAMLVSGRVLIPHGFPMGDSCHFQ